MFLWFSYGFSIKTSIFLWFSIKFTRGYHPLRSSSTSFFAESAPRLPVPRISHRWSCATVPIHAPKDNRWLGKSLGYVMDMLNEINVVVENMDL